MGGTERGLWMRRPRGAGEVVQVDKVDMAHARGRGDGAVDVGAGVAAARASGAGPGRVGAV